MKKRAITGVLAAAVCMTALSGCALHTHEYAPADCLNPAVCTVCGKTEGEPLGHTFAPADCTTPATCTVCSATEGEPLGHDETPADCTTPAVCKVCGEETGKALGHSTDFGICSRCKEEQNLQLLYDLTDEFIEFTDLNIDFTLNWMMYSEIDQEDQMSYLWYAVDGKNLADHISAMIDICGDISELSEFKSLLLKMQAEQERIDDETDSILYSDLAVYEAPIEGGGTFRTHSMGKVIREGLSGDFLDYSTDCSEELQRLYGLFGIEPDEELT